MLPSPSREKTKTKFRSKRDEFMSVTGLNESMDDACMAEIRLVLVSELKKWGIGDVCDGKNNKKSH